MNKHDVHLERIVNNMSMIDEDKKDFKFIFTNGIYLCMMSENLRKMCDIFAGYNDGSIFLGELKGSYVRTEKAIQQLLSGKELAESLGLVVKTMKFIVYHGMDDYEYMVVENERCPYKRC